MENRDNPVTRAEFLDWCAAGGLTARESLSAVFDLTPQTLRNWERDPDSPVPRHVVLCGAGLSAWRRAGLGPFPCLPDPTEEWFSAWRARRGLRSLAAAARLLGLPRQSASRWVATGEMPRWLPLACLGAEVTILAGMPLAGMDF